MSTLLKFDGRTTMAYVVDDDDYDDSIDAVSPECRDLVIEWVRVAAAVKPIDFGSIDANVSGLYEALSFVDRVYWIGKRETFGIPVDCGERFCCFQYERIEDAEVRKHLPVLVEYVQKRARHVTKGARS